MWYLHWYQDKDTLHFIGLVLVMIYYVWYISNKCNDHESKNKQNNQLTKETNDE